MTQGEILKMMADQVVENGNCVLEVTLFSEAAVAHLIPAELWIAEGEGFDNEEE